MQKPSEGGRGAELLADGCLFPPFALKVLAMPARAGTTSAPPAGGQATLPSPGSCLSNCCFWRRKNTAAEMGRKGGEGSRK